MKPVKNAMRLATIGEVGEVCRGELCGEGTGKRGKRREEALVDDIGDCGKCQNGTHSMGEAGSEIHHGRAGDILRWGEE